MAISGNALRATGFFLVVSSVMGLSAPVQAAGPAAEKGPVILLEPERAGTRGDRMVLRLNDDASVIPAHRIKALPIVDGRMGERVVLDGGLQLYFPFGRIIEARSEIGKYREDATGKIELNPLFSKVTTFDVALGPVCSSVQDIDGQGGRVEMRLGPDKAISIVGHKISKANAPDDETYRVVTVTEFRHIRQEAYAERLYQACTSAGPKPKLLARE